MLTKIFDEYSLNARVRPSLLALLPLIVTTYIVTPSLYNFIAGLFSIIVACGFITALAHYSRHQGRKTEKRLYVLWGGKPTTIMLRNSDEGLDKHTKARYHQYLSENIRDWAAPEITDEHDNLNQADEYYDSAVRWLLEKSRNTKTHPLIFKENISYGFRRNSRGIKWVGITFSILAIMLTLFNLYPATEYLDIKKHSSDYGAMTLSCIMLLWWSFIVDDSWVKDAAESYALRLLAVCENQF